MALEVGSKVSGKVTSMTNFGVFVELADKKTGMVHISEVAHTYVKNVSDVLSVGDEVFVKVVAIAENGKISLSIKQASEENAPKEKARTKEQSTPKEQRILPKFSDTSKQNKQDDFDSLMSAFLKDSSERLLDLKRNTEGKRGGRGGRRN